jgi:hypothetical protein
MQFSLKQLVLVISLSGIMFPYLYIQFERYRADRFIKSRCEVLNSNHLSGVAGAELTSNLHLPPTGLRIARVVMEDAIRLARIKSIQRVEVYDSHLGIDELNEILTLPNLRNLFVFDSKIELINGSLRLGNLQKLSLIDSKIVFESVVLSCKSLTDIKLDGSSINQELIEAIVSNSSVHSLSFLNSRCSGSIVEALRKTKMPVAVFVDGCKLTDSDFQILQGLKQIELVSDEYDIYRSKVSSF